MSIDRCRWSYIFVAKRISINVHERTYIGVAERTSVSLTVYQRPWTYVYGCHWAYISVDERTSVSLSVHRRRWGCCELASVPRWQPRVWSQQVFRQQTDETSYRLMFVRWRQKCNIKPWTFFLEIINALLSCQNTSHMLSCPVMSCHISTLF